MGAKYGRQLVVLSGRLEPPVRVVGERHRRTGTDLRRRLSQRARGAWAYLLFGFNHEEEDARAAALQALLVTGGGGLALLAGLVLLGQIGGSFEIPQLLTQGAAVRPHPLYSATLLLVLIGAFTKSAPA